MSFFMPTKLYSGRDCIKNNASVFSAFGKKALIVTGRTSAKASGALDDIISVLQKDNIAYDIFDKVLNNPTVENCYEGGMLAKKSNVDFIVAIGGGSPLDASKAIAMYATNDIEPLDIFLGEQKNKPLSIIAVPTTAGTGSEVTQYSVLTVDSEETKKSFSTNDTFATVAFLDARYTESLPLGITIDTAVDALSHSLESILNKRTNKFSELYAKEALKLIGKAIPALISGDITFEIREILLLASMYAGVSIAQTGTTVVHSMGYPLTYYKGLTHGNANGLLLSSFLEGCDKANHSLVNELLGYLGLEDLNEFDEVLKKLMPNRNILTNEEAKKFASKTIKAKNVASCIWDITEAEEYSFFAKLTK